MLADEKLMMLKICRLYYYDNLTQAEIAQIIGVSRSFIAKALVKAREERLVEITVDDGEYHSAELERQFKSLFSLEEAVIVPTADMSVDKANSSLYRTASSYIYDNIKDSENVGVSWGYTLYHLLNEFPSGNCDQLKLLPLVGGMGSQYIEWHANQIAYELSKKLNALCIPFHAPAVAESEYYRDLLLQTPYIADFLAEARQVDTAIIGIGEDPFGDTSSIQQMGYLGPAEKADLKQAKAVGDTGGWFFDEKGNVVPNMISSRVIGVSPEDMKGIRKVIAVASGPSKVKSIAAALKGGFITTIVTDDKTAERVVHHLQTSS